MKTKYFWQGLFEHCIAATDNGPSFRHRFVNAEGKTADNMNCRKDITSHDIPFWERYRGNGVYRISRASFRNYLKTGVTPEPMKRKA